MPRVCHEILDRINMMLTHVQCSEPKTWSPTISKLVEVELATLRPYELTLTYDDWTMRT